MIAIFFLLPLVVFLNFTPTINGQGCGKCCVPSMVQNLRINANASLTWEKNENEICVIWEYRVDIVGDKGDEYHFAVTSPDVDVSFLPICEEWEFVVTPVTNGILGFERRLTDYIPLPPSADISLNYFNVTQVDLRDVLLEWDLLNHTHGDCTLRYRVTLEDEETSDIHDIYVTGRSVHLHNLSPCVQYHLGIRAINRAHPTIEGPARFHNIEIPPQPEAAPSVRNIDIGSTTVNMTWRLENPGRNRCPIRTLYVDGGNNFNIELPLTDSVERPPVELNLKGLRPNSMYYFQVSVENSGGKSAATPLAVQTLESESSTQ